MSVLSGDPITLNNQAIRGTRITVARRALTVKYTQADSKIRAITHATMVPPSINGLISR